jgi:putative Holliday junction resolvase
MRILALDLGRRRVGLAISDPSGLIARPLTTLTVTPATMMRAVLDAIATVAAEDDGLDRIVVGLPRHLDGTKSAETEAVETFVARLRQQTDIPVVTCDERLSSIEAESRLALRERDWRRRKAQLDAAAAAVVLQDYLDASGGV